MKTIKKGVIALVFIICFMLVYVVFIYGAMFLFPQKESFIPPIEIIREDINAYDNEGQYEAQDTWYRVQNTIPLAWNFSYVDEKAYFISRSGASIIDIEDAGSTIHTDIVMVDSRKLEMEQEQYLIAYEVGIVDIYTATADEKIKKTNSINTSNIIILAKFIGSDIFVLTLNYDFQPEIFWFREHESGMKQIGHMTMEEKFQHIGKAIAIDGVGIFVHIDDGIILFDNKTMKYVKHYDFVSLENVLGNNKFYVMEYTKGTTTGIDVYVDKNRVLTFYEDNINTSIGVISDTVDSDASKKTSKNTRDSNAVYLDKGLDKEEERKKISLYGVSKQNKIYMFK